MSLTNQQMYSTRCPPLHKFLGNASNLTEVFLATQWVQFVCLFTGKIIEKDVIRTHPMPSRVNLICSNYCMSRNIPIALDLLYGNVWWCIRHLHFLALQKSLHTKSMTLYAFVIWMGVFMLHIPLQLEITGSNILLFYFGELKPEKPLPVIIKESLVHKGFCFLFYHKLPSKTYR